MRITRLEAERRAFHVPDPTSVASTLAVPKPAADTAVSATTTAPSAASAPRASLPSVVLAVPVTTSTRGAIPAVRTPPPPAPDVEVLDEQRAVQVLQRAWRAHRLAKPFEVGEVKALLWDVFGTVVDWHTSIVDAARALFVRKGIDADPEDFAEGWIKLYQPSMESIRNGSRPWTPLQTLFRESLVTLLDSKGISLDETEIDDLSRAWQRLQPWPDSSPGLHRLASKFVVAPCSNGDIKMMTALGQFADLPWHVVLGAEPTQAYKPQWQAYLGSVRLLGLRPEQCIFVAAHNYDVLKAQSLGFRTAFVRRPLEAGPARREDPQPEGHFDFVVDSIEELASRLGV